MPKTYAQIVDDVETILQDAGIDPSPPAANSVFATAEIDALMPMGLVVISQAKPWEYRLTKTTTADSYDLTLTAGDKWRLLEGTGYKGTGIVKAEYLVNEDPRRFRGVTRFANTLSLELDSRPSSAVSVYLYMNKIHLLGKEIGTADTAGAIKTLAAIGATSLALKSLGTGTINEQTYLTIAGDSTTYCVTDQATIAANEATVAIWPPLQAAAAVDAVVTLTLAGATFDMLAEGYLARWVAAMLCVSKATKSYAQVNTAITTIANAATAIGAIAAQITLGIEDVASGRTSAALAVTADAAIAALIALATTAGTGDIALARAAAVSAAGTITTAITGSTARITQAVADFASARTETAKLIVVTTGALDVINSEVDKILALLEDATTGARKDIADGETELDKVAALITTQGGAAIDAITALIALATTAGTGDLALARAAIVLGVTDISNAKTQMDIIDEQVDLAITALNAGNSLINTITLGGGAPEYMAQANADVGAAQGEMLAGQGKLQEASGNFNNANADLQVAVRDLDTARTKIQEATAIFEEAKMDIAADRAFTEHAAAKIRLGQGYIMEAQGYVMEVNARLATSASYIGIGTGELRGVDAKLREGSAYQANANAYLNAANADFRAATEKGQEAASDRATANSYFAAAAAAFQAAAVKAQEAVTNLNLVASRLQVSAGGQRYETWGRQELAAVKAELLAYGGLPRSVRYPRD